MNIDKLTVRIGGHEKVLTDLDSENGDVVELMRAAMLSRICYTVIIEIPQTPEMASAIGRLLYGPKAEALEIKPPEIKPPGGADPVDVPGFTAEQIDALGRRIDELDFSVRTANTIQKLGYEYVWHLAERYEPELLKSKGIGRHALNEIKDELYRLGLRLRMDLSALRERYPGFRHS